MWPCWEYRAAGVHINSERFEQDLRMILYILGSEIHIGQLVMVQRVM